MTRACIHLHATRIIIGSESCAGPLQYQWSTLLTSTRGLAACRVLHGTESTQLWKIAVVCLASSWGVNIHPMHQRFGWLLAMT